MLPVYYDHKIKTRVKINNHHGNSMTRNTERVNQKRCIYTKKSWGGGWGMKRKIL
jgi:hypothetical protein